MGKKRDAVKVAVTSTEGRKLDLKAKGIVLLFEERERVGVFMNGDMDPKRLGGALVYTLEQMTPGSDEEDALLALLEAVCICGARSRKLRDYIEFRHETADMIRELLGEDEGGADDE